MDVVPRVFAGPRSSGGGGRAERCGGIGRFCHARKRGLRHRQSRCPYVAGRCRRRRAACNYLPVDLDLSLLDAAPIADEWVEKPFAETDGFSTLWWVGSAKGPLTFCVFTDEVLGEVARAEISLYSDTGERYPTYSLPSSGATEIGLLEVRDGLKGRSIGRHVVDCIRAKFPGPYIAVSLDNRSDRFWRSLGWTEHQRDDFADARPDGARPRPLFVQAE